MLTRINVDKRQVGLNRKNGTAAPVLIVTTYKGAVRGNTVAIEGPSRMVYSPDKPLSNGARVWLETEAPVTVFLSQNAGG